MENTIIVKTVLDPATQVARQREEAVKEKLGNVSMSESERARVIQIIGLDSTLYNPFLAGEMTAQDVLNHGNHVVLAD